MSNGKKKDQLMFLDIETTMDHSRIHLVVTKNQQGKVECHRNVESLNQSIKGKTLIAHNGIGFDFPVLNKLWNTKIRLNQVLDTLVLSRLMNPQRKHSLAAWGETLKFPKTDFKEFDEYSEEMQQYCINDVEVLEKVYQELEKERTDYGFSQECIILEHEVASIVSRQVSRGFRIDLQKCKELVERLRTRMENLEKQLQQSFRPIITERFSQKTGKRLKDDIEIFNPASRQQIAKRLTTLGWNPKKFTDKGTVIVDEAVLGSVDIPEAKLICEYLLLQKRLAQSESWIKHTNDRSRVCGKVITNGAVTGRMTHHSPNLAQVPSVSAPYGAECRELWTVDAGHKLVGIDASGLELRMLAHYMNDDNYTREILDGDIHSKNQQAAGLDTRAKAKTFIYAFLYGASARKIGTMVQSDGQETIDKFMENVPALAKLKKRIEKTMQQTPTLPSLDGRRLHVRSAHSALNTLLQGAGAVVMKKALIIFNKYIKTYQLDAHFVANVHDEWQVEASVDDAELVGQLGVKAIVEAGKALNLNCPLDGEYKVGNNWKETH